MSICENNIYKSLIKLNNSINTLLCSFEYLDYEFFNSYFASIDEKKYEHIIILIKESFTNCYNYTHTNTLQILSNLSNKNITVKTNPNLDFSGILINNSKLFIPLYNNSMEINDFYVSTSNDNIFSFKNKFDIYLQESNEFKFFYELMLDKYIDKSLNINQKIEIYLNDLNDNNLNYKNSQFYCDLEKKLTSYQIPQFSDFQKGAYKLPILINENNNVGYTFTEIGKLLLGPGKKNGAYCKYGENHSKLAESLGLVYITSKPKYVYLSDLGIKFINLSQNDKELFLKYQIYNMPLVKHIFNTCFTKSIDIVDFIIEVSGLSLSTAKRRSSNVKNLIEILLEDCSENIYKIFSNSLYNKNKPKKKNLSNIQYKLSLDEKNKLLKFINNKLCKNKYFLSIEIIFKSIKLHFSNLLKINNIKTSIEFTNFLLSEFNDYYNICYPIISTKKIPIKDPFIHFLEENLIINRNDLIDFLLNCGYSKLNINNKLDMHLGRLIRLDFDTYILKSNFNISIENINQIKNSLNKKLDKSVFFSLFNYADLTNLPDIEYEYNQYILSSIIFNYINDDFKMIYKFSNTTYKYNYLFVVSNDSNIYDFTDLLINIINTYYSEFDLVNFSDISSYLLINNICDSLHKSFIDSQKIHIDNLKRLEIL